MRRVKKEEIKFDRFIQPDGLEYCLACWKDWMLGDDRDLSASRMQLRGGTDDKEVAGYESDPYREQRIADNIIGEATGAMIDDLRPQHSWAIKKVAGITTVWRFPQLDYMETAIDAKIQLEIKLRRNIATAIKFD